MKADICNFCFGDGLLRVAIYRYMPEDKFYYVCKKHKKEVEKAGFRTMELKSLFEP
jgi:hypothetical protein